MSLLSRPTPAPSLLPYLQGGGEPPRLKLSLVPSAETRPAGRYPFEVIDDASPYMRLIEASFETDAGSPLVSVFLQVQKDHCTLATDPLCPMTNPDLEQWWQEAFRMARTGAGGHIVLSAQVDRRGTLYPLAPLFYCRTRQHYFHPVCPSCGGALDLCRDDALLEQSGLAPFTTSLKRYLWCPVCSGLSAPRFYVSERDHSDPLTVRDRWSLITDFGQMRDVPELAGAIPCSGCPDHAACFGPAHAVHDTIIPFAFYPFHLVVRSAPTLAAADFLQLVAGATVEELLAAGGNRPNPARAARLAPFSGSGRGLLTAPGDDRAFLEILYLKLTFLGEILERYLIPGGGTVRIRDDRIWIRIPEGGRLLPRFWTFETYVYDDVIPSSPEGVGLTQSADTALYLGVLWFQTLLRNSVVDQKAIVAAVVEGRQVPAGEGGELRMLAIPDNCYWHPERGRVLPEWRPLWERACSLGYRLLDGTDARRREGAELAASLEELRCDIRDALFSGALPRAEGDARGALLDTGTIRGVLTKLIEKARHDVRSAEPFSAGVDFDDESMETVILSPRPPQPPSPPAGDAGLVDTYLIPPAAAGTQEPPPQPASAGGILETVLLGRPGRDHRHQPVDGGEPPSPPAAGELLETVMLASPVRGLRHQPVGGGGRTEEPPPPDTPQQGEADLLSETIVVMPRGMRPRPGGRT